MESTTAYKCLRCKRWFQPGMFACGVIHTNGECCHAGQKEVRVVEIWKGTETILCDGKIVEIAAPNPNAKNIIR